jgi:hypothetical protein
MFVFAPNLDVWGATKLHASLNEFVDIAYPGEGGQSVAVAANYSIT